MPGPTHGRSTRIMLGAYNVSANFNDVSIPAAKEEVDVTGFEATGKSFIVGSTDGTVSLNGFFDGAAGGIDEQLSTIFADTATPMTAAWQGDTLGYPATLVNLRETSYEIGSSIGGVSSVSSGGRADGGPDYGRILHSLGAETSTGNSTSVDFTSTTSNGFAATLHITARSGTTPSLTAKIQDSADNSTFADVASGAFAAATATGAQFISATTSVRRYVREAHTLSGTSPLFTYQVSFAKR